MEPKAGLMLGASREGDGDKLSSWEQLRIEQAADGTVTLRGIGPGRYKINVNTGAAPGWTAAAAKVDTVDAIDGPLEIAGTAVVDHGHACAFDDVLTADEAHSFAATARNAMRHEMKLSMNP